MQRRAFLGLAIAAAATPPGEAGAHAMPNSSVWVEQLPGSVQLTVSIPLSELAAVLGNGRKDTAAFSASLLGYISDHASIVGSDGAPWTAELKDVASADGRNGEHPIIVVLLAFTPSPGASARPARLRYDAVNHRVASHYVLVYRRLGEDTVPLGRLQSPDRELPLP
jgi:hypothetical protein